MLILLPPSEGKTSPTEGPSLDLANLSFPELTKPRERVLAAIQKLGDGPRAAATLGLGKKSADEASLNVEVLSAPCAKAIDLYTGVLYDHLDPSTLDEGSLAGLASNVWIGSALFGFVGPEDLIPNHRLSASVKLPRLGAMGPWWRKQMEASRSTELSVAGRAIFDARSGGYRSMFQAPEADIVELAVVEEGSAGRKVITHMAKKWRGLATRYLLQDRSLTLDSSTSDILRSLASMAQGETRAGVLDLEVAPSKPTKQGGSITIATLVTASTE